VRTLDANPTLPPAVENALATAIDDPGRRTVTVASGIPFSAIAWGDVSASPLILIHGITASARIWWRVGPALAASGRRVIALDLPGHGQTGHWIGHHRFRDNATDVAAWVRAADVDRPDLEVVGHSWGAMTAAALPIAGIRPRRLVLLDPPCVPFAVISRMASDPSEVTYPDLETAIAAVTRENPAWSAEDVQAKAEALVELDIEAARSVLLENGDWDGGLSSLTEPAAAGVAIRMTRGDPEAGSYVPDTAIPAFEAVIGEGNVATMPGAAHAPQRLQPAQTTAGILAALA